MRIKEISHIDNSQVFYEIHWLITRRCSFSCSYCPPHRHNPKSFQATNDSLLQALLKLESIVPNENIRLNLTGGEPTIHPNFKEFIANAIKLEKVKAIRIVTNLSSNEKIYSNLANEANNSGTKFYLVASFHWESASPQRFINNLKVLLDSKVEVQVKIMLDEKGSEKILSVLSSLKELNAKNKNIAVAVQRIRNTQNLEIDLIDFETKYFEQVNNWGDLREFILETDNDEVVKEKISNIDLIIKNKLNSFYNWTCFTGANTLFIDNDGCVYSALCKPDLGSIGNIFDTSLFQIPQSVLCPHKLCECGSTVRIPKINNYEDLHSKK
jgi:MoaA/NifB/PqqE/SkfB family radical SAM enzyme